MAEGDTLQTGDRLWFRIRTEQAAYIYVIQIFSDGSAELLYPEGGDVLLPADDAQRVPSDPRQHFVLDARPGREHVLLISSRTRLVQSDSRLANLVSIVKRQRKWPSDVPLDAAGQAAPTPADDVDEQEEENGQADGRADSHASAPGIGSTRPGVRPRLTAGGDTHGTQSKEAATTAKPEGFLDLIGQNRSLELERGLRLATDPSGLHVIPDDAGIAVSLFWFRHAP